MFRRKFLFAVFSYFEWAKVPAREKSEVLARRLGCHSLEGRFCRLVLGTPPQVKFRVVNVLNVGFAKMLLAQVEVAERVRDRGNRAGVRQGIDNEQPQVNMLCGDTITEVA